LRCRAVSNVLRTYREGIAFNQEKTRDAILIYNAAGDYKSPLCYAIKGLEKTSLLNNMAVGSFTA